MLQFSIEELNLNIFCCKLNDLLSFPPTPRKSLVKSVSRDSFTPFPLIRFDEFIIIISPSPL
ncbi:hypothetical protein HanRHA438_Chr02g0093691 [Helianthus annuus]|nr:hypothetical protein HanRHA438_Chr02g0093691 [Helianthus annuus]